MKSNTVLQMRENAISLIVDLNVRLQRGCAVDYGYYVCLVTNCVLQAHGFMRITVSTEQAQEAIQRNRLNTVYSERVFNCAKHLETEDTEGYQQLLVESLKVWVDAELPAPKQVDTKRIVACAVGIASCATYAIIRLRKKK